MNFKHFLEPRRAFSSLILALALVLLAASTTAAEPKAERARVDVNKLLSDVQISSGSSDEVELVWWVPEEFWLASFQDDASMTEKQKQEFVSMLRPYVVIAIVRGAIGNFGVISYTDEREIRASLRLTGTDGKTYLPIDESKASSDATMVVRIIKPMLANAMGKLGENMNFYLFPATSKEGARIADPQKPGALAVAVGGDEVKFRLPLGSLLPPRYDPGTGEQFPGNYQFNPFTGTALTTTAPQAARNE